MRCVCSYQERPMPAHLFPIRALSLLRNENVLPLFCVIFRFQNATFSRWMRQSWCTEGAAISKHHFLLCWNMRIMKIPFAQMQLTRFYLKMMFENEMSALYYSTLTQARRSRRPQSATTFNSWFYNMSYGHSNVVSIVLIRSGLIAQRVVKQEMFFAVFRCH